MSAAHSDMKQTPSMEELDMADDTQAESPWSKQEQKRALRK